MRVERELHKELGAMPAQARLDISSSSSETLRTRRVSVQLSKRIFEQLEAATDRPGVGKSMIIEDALDSFLTPRPPIEALLQAHSEQLSVRLDSLDQDIQIIANTVALLAQYQLEVRPAAPNEDTTHDTSARKDLIAVAGEGGSNYNFRHKPN